MIAPTAIINGLG